jgi:hypothetical protein
MNRASRLATTVLVSSGLGLGLGLGAGIAHANDDPFQLWPGDDKGGYQGLFNSPADATPHWDWGVCHTYYSVPDDRPRRLGVEPLLSATTEPILRDFLAAKPERFAAPRGFAAVNTATYARFGMAMVDHDTYAALGV